MLFLKFVLVALATACVLMLFTYAWVAAQSRGAKAVGLFALSANDLAFATVLATRGRDTGRSWLALSALGVRRLTRLR